MAARFEKIATGPLGDFDGFDKKTQYQMVPVGKTREMSVVTDAGARLLRSRDPSVARFANVKSSPPLQPSAESTPAQIAIPPNRKVEFSIVAIQVGHTELVLERPDGVPEASLLVSVKSKVTKSFALCILADIRRSAGFLDVDMVRFMNGARKTYLQQANLELTQPGTVETVTVPRDLGDPLVLDKPGITDSIVEATPGRVFAANLVIYGCWNVDLRKERIVGLTLSNLCFVERSTNFFVTSITFGHEVGHGLGLDHNGDQDRMMFKDVSARSSRLSQFEIDTINSSGTV